jgi:stage V sporulation protein B
VNIQGAAVGTVVCYAAAGIADVVYLFRKTGIRLKLWDMFIKPIVASAVMAAVVYVVYTLLSGMGSRTIAVIAAVIVGVLVYAALIVILKMLSKDDLTFIPGGRKLSRFLLRGKGKENER